MHTPMAHKGLEGILSGCESEKMGSVHLERRLPEYRLTYHLKTLAEMTKTWGIPSAGGPLP